MNASFATPTTRRLAGDLMNDDDNPGLLYFLVFFAFLFTLMCYMLGCFATSVVPS